MQRIVTFKIDSELLKILDRYAKSKRMTRSEVIREAIIRLLESEGIKVEPLMRRSIESRGPVIEITV